MPTRLFMTYRRLAAAALLLLASGCGETQRVAIAPSTAVPCEALKTVRPTAAEVDALSDATVMDIDANNTAIRSGCGRRPP